MALTKFLITVKTYPTNSKKYEELICIAGFREDGSWVRIYPVQYRKKAYQEQYAKYDWIEMDLVKRKLDFRPESYRPVSHYQPIHIIGKIAPDGDTWKERRNCILNKVYKNMSLLISEAKNKDICTSLAVFKPKKVIDFVCEPVERAWTTDMLSRFKQLNIFQHAERKQFEMIKKLPYKFSFVYEDEEGKRCKTIIEDWETGQLYWSTLQHWKGDEKKACEDVRKKYMNDFAETKDLHFFMGTTQIQQFTAKNPFLIIGIFYPNPITQLELF
jgi:hypothetical protein